MAAELDHQARIQRIETFQRVAHMQALNRAARAFQRAVARGGERNHRAVEALFNARRQNADHALMPLGMVHRQATRQRVAAALQFFAQGQRFGLHSLLNLFTCLVQGVQLVGQHARLTEVVAQQQRDANGHIVQSSGRVQARPERKAQIACRQLERVAVGNFQQRLDPRTALARPDTAQALPGQNTVIGIERHHVRDGTQRHQIEIFGQVWYGNTAGFEPALVA